MIIWITKIALTVSVRTNDVNLFSH